MSNRNQHFVPQVYLRRFGVASGTAPKLINLFVITSGKPVANASIRHQASRNYFYGNESIYEDFVQYFEGRYGAVITKLERGELSTEDIRVLVQFMFLQYLRTPFQLKERLRLIEEWRDLKIAGRRVRDSLPPPDKVREVQQQLYIFAKEHLAFGDLEPVLLINRTKLPLLSSDNPSMLMNRLYAQRYGDETAGAIQSGAVAYLPLTPRVGLFAYDRDVYKHIGQDHVSEVRKESDVSRLNELQVIRASDVIFFHDWADREYVAGLFARHAARRREEWTVSWSGIRDGVDGDFERFRKVTSGDEDSLEPRIQSISPILPAPSTWPSFLKFKMRPVGFSNGSAAGFVRKAHAGNRGGLRKMPLPDSLPANQVPAHREVIYQRKDAE